MKGYFPPLRAFSGAVWLGRGCDIAHTILIHGCFMDDSAESLSLHVPSGPSNHPGDLRWLQGAQAVVLDLRYPLGLQTPLCE